MLTMNSRPFRDLVYQHDDGASECATSALGGSDLNRDYFASEALRSSSTLRAIRNALTPAGIPQ